MLPVATIYTPECNAMKNVVDIKKGRKKAKQQTPDEAVDSAIKRFIDDQPKDLEEPKGMASGGDMSRISEKEDEIDD